MSEPLTNEQATELAQRIINTMRPTPPLTDWVEELVGLNHERAWRIFRSFRTERDGGLTIGAYMHAYREDVANERRARIEVAPNHCELCNGTGWVEASNIEAHNPRVCTKPAGELGCACKAVKPCRCSNAHQAHRVVELIHNGRDAA